MENKNNSYNFNLLLPSFAHKSCPIWFQIRNLERKKKTPTYEMSRMGGTDAGVHDIS